MVQAKSGAWPLAAPISICAYPMLPRVQAPEDEASALSDRPENGSSDVELLAVTETSLSPTETFLA